ncbi:MAG: zinc-binding dehydrogenase, partial [Saprospiraceae bacterium]|nr:zinc-binding dehydrogenase [Saprospiraceae bacterium]
MNRRTYRMNPGNIENLQISTEPLPAPAMGEVQVEVRAIGLNFADLYTVWGMYKAAPKEDFIPGLEYAGVIAEVGDGVTQWQAGDQVMGITRFGAYVDRLNIDAHYITRIPQTWSFTEGAAFLVQALTAYYGLIELARTQPGETVLIHSAAGGVGIQANRIARRLGAVTIGTVGRAEKLPLLEKEGYDKGIVRSKHFRRDLEAALDGRPLNVIMESIGGSILMDGFRTLAMEGRMVVF